MEDRLEDILDLVAWSENCPKRWKDLFTSIIALSSELNAMSDDEYKTLLQRDQDFIQLIKSTLGIDVSDLSK